MVVREPLVEVALDERDGDLALLAAVDLVVLVEDALDAGFLTDVARLAGVRFATDLRAAVPVALAFDLLDVARVEVLFLLPCLDAGDAFLAGALCFVVAFFAAGVFALDRVVADLLGEVLDLVEADDLLVAVRPD